MSESKNKDARRQRKEQGLNYRSPSEIQEEKANKKSRRSAIIFLAVFVVVAIVVLIMNTGAFYRNVSAVEIDGEKYSITEFNYYYHTAYMTEMTSGYASYYIDRSTPLSSQAYMGDDSISWADHFEETAIENMEDVAMLLSLAEQAGMTELDEDSQSDLDSALEELKTAAEESEEYSTLNKYLAASYGKGMNYDFFVKIMNKVYLAQQYSQSIQDDFTDNYTDEELEEHYLEKADEFDYFAYRSFLVSDTTDDTEATDDAEGGTDAQEGEEATADEGMAQAKAIAETIAQARSEEEFISLVYENADEASKETYAEDAATLTENVVGSNLASYDFGEWLQEADRQAGDTTVVQAESGYYAVYFVERNGNETELVDLRHILVTPEEEDEEDADDNADSDADTEEAQDEDALTEKQAEALAKAEDILAQWEAGEATEESFGELAADNSDDSGSSDNGGLYENVYPNQMTEEFNDWVFDENRQPGDAEIVRSESYGFHLIYFIGKTGQTYRNYLAEQSKLADDYEAWTEQYKEDFTLTKLFFLRFAM